MSALDQQVQQLEELENLIIEHYGTPVDAEHEFYLWTKKQEFDVNDDNYEAWYDLFIENKLRKHEWYQVYNNYYTPQDMEYAFSCYNIDKKNNFKDPYSIITEENCAEF